MTLYTHFLVTWCGEDKREDAQAALAEAAGVPVSVFPVPLEHTAIDGARGWADWSACRPVSIPLFLSVARTVCGVGTYEHDKQEGTHSYYGTRGAWTAWKRSRTPGEDGQRALNWLARQGWQRVREEEP